MSERFYITVIPGLESASHLELCEKWFQTPDFFYPQVEYFKGGLEVELPFDQGCVLNQKLRTITRILYRAHDFSCPDIQIFQSEIQKISWSHFYKSKEELNIVFSSRSSKLSKIKQIEDVFRKDLGFKIAKSGKKVFVRIFRDHCQISIDTTGDRSQFRGQNKKVGKAPLRDSTAASLLRILAQGLRGEAFLIDPMMGSGTFLLEALQMNQLLDRDFTYQSFSKCKNIKIQQTKNSIFRKVYGFDKDKKMLEIVKHNFSKVPMDKYELGRDDLFSDKPFKGDEGYRCVVFNPPWGKRLQKNNEAVSQWFSAIDHKFNPQRVGLLVPTPFTIPALKWEKVRDVYFQNSGVLNRFIVFSR